ncbi:MAG: transposase [Rubrivivax sp.]|nr:transposase [Rubrivivax sp.]
MCCGADRRQALEQLCRYITHPALANERVQYNPNGQVERKLKIPWRDGTRHLVMTPLESVQRLAGLLPQPRLQPPSRAHKKMRSVAAPISC